MIQNSFLEKGKEKELEFALALCKAKSLSSSIIRSLKGKIDFSNFTTNRDDMFRVYRRKDRLDAIVKVDSDFLTKVTSSFLIPKE